MHQIQSGAVEATACLCSSQIAVKKTDDVAKEIAFVEQVQADTKRGWLFMFADATTIHQPFCNGGAHSLVVGSGAYVHVCPKSYASHTLLQALPERWRGLDLRSANGKTLKVWGMREVAYNALDVDGKVFTVRIRFVVCEVRKPLLSLAILVDRGFHVTVGCGSRTLGGHGRGMCLRRNHVDMVFRSGLLEKRRKVGYSPGLVASMESDAAGLSVTAGVSKKRAVIVAGLFAAAGENERRTAFMAGHSVIAGLEERRTVAVQHLKYSVVKQCNHINWLIFHMFHKVKIVLLVETMKVCASAKMDAKNLW